MDNKDFYKILGIEETATDEEIKAAYRKMAKQYHPDHNEMKKNAEEKFKEISEAYRVLIDPELRGKYDLTRTLIRNRRSPKGQKRDYDDVFSSSGGFQDFFESFKGKKKSRQTTLKDINVDISIGLEDVYCGKEIHLDVKGEPLKFKLLPGAYDGLKLKFTGKGNKPLMTEPGDLYVRIKVNKHSHYVYSKLDLYFEKEVNLYTMVLGGNVVIEHLDKSKINVQIPAESPNGKILRLKGLGITDYKNQGLKGDLYVILKVILPAGLSEAEKKLYKSLRELSSNHK